METSDQGCKDAISNVVPDSQSAPLPAYLAYWSKEVFSLKDEFDQRQVIGPDFFCDENGYDPDDIENLAALNIGEIWQSSDFGPSHTVERIS